MVPAIQKGLLSSDPGIWLIGAKGMLGRQLAMAFAAKGFAFFASDQEVDIRRLQCLQDFTHGKKITWMVNCAAYTAVDRAESEPERALAVNAVGVENLARLAADLGARLIHFSSDYVFAGDRNKPYRENARPRPLSRYGQSKRQGEISLLARLDTFFLFRISWLYGVYGPNFVHTMLKVFQEKETARVVNDQFGSPTYAAVLAENIAGLIGSGSDRFGLYHYCDRGAISWFDFARRIMDLALEFGLIPRRIPLQAVSTAAFPTAAVRPPYSVLDSGKVMGELGFQVFDWELNLKKYFREKVLLGSTP